jgi:hypothetical protein
MSEELDVVVNPNAPVKLSPAEQAVAKARDSLSRYLDRAVAILQELAETSENDRVRLAAVDSILDRSGVIKETKQQVSTGSQSEHDNASREAAEILAKIQRNQQQVAQGPAGIPLDVLIVHEGDVEGAS